MFEYTFSKDPLKLGVYDSTYGQAWWGEVAEDLKPVKFNLMDASVELHAMDKITCAESMNRRTTPRDGKEPKDYLQLKKVQVVPKDGSQAPQNAQMATPSQGFPELTSLLDSLNRIEKKLDKLLDNDASLIGDQEFPVDEPMPDYPGDTDDPSY